MFMLVKFGGLADFNPAEQVEEFKAFVKPGMTWQQVLAKYPTKKMGRISYTDVAVKTMPVKFEEAELAKQVAANALGDGFFLHYVFTAEEQYQVFCDGKGVVRRVERQMSTMDIMEGKLYKGGLGS